MKIYKKTQPNENGQKFNFQSAGKHAKVSLALFIIAAVILLMDITGPIVLSSGHEFISSRLHDQLAFLALLSVLLIPIILMIGTILGIIGWLTERKQSGHPSRVTVIAVFLNLISFLIAILLISAAIIFLVGPYTDLPSWPGW